MSGFPTERIEPVCRVCQRLDYAGRSHARFDIDGATMGVKIDLLGTGIQPALARHQYHRPCPQSARRGARHADAEEAAAGYVKDAALPDARGDHRGRRCPIKAKRWKPARRWQPSKR